MVTLPNPIAGPLPGLEGQPDPQVLAQLQEGVAQAQQPQEVNQPPATMGEEAGPSVPSAPVQLPPRPPGTSSLGSYQGTKGQIFRNMLGDFLYSAGKGLAASGHGPEANARGAGAALTALPERHIQQQQIAMQQQQAQAAEDYKNAQAQALNAQNAQVQVPVFGSDGKPVIQDGQLVTRPMTQKDADAFYTKMAVAGATGAAGVAKTAEANKGKVEAAGVQKRFLVTPSGLFDTQNEKFVQGGASSIVITPDIAKDYGIPKDLVGNQIPLTQFSQLERGGAMVEGNKIRSRMANVAEAGLSLRQQQFERDTFGTLFGKDIPSSLVTESGDTIGWKSPSAPTGNIKTQAQQSQDLVGLFKDVRDEIDKAEKSGKLGPLQGRINDIMVGKVGADDPEFARLRALGSLALSGTLKAHFGARGGGLVIYQDFENKFNTGKMTAGDLKGGLSAFETFMGKYAKRAETVADRNKKGPGAGGYSPDNPFAPKK